MRKLLVLSLLILSSTVFGQQGLRALWTETIPKTTNYYEVMCGSFSFTNQLIISSTGAKVRYVPTITFNGINGNIYAYSIKPSSWMGDKYTFPAYYDTIRISTVALENMALSTATTIMSVFYTSMTELERIDRSKLDASSGTTISDLIASKLSASSGTLIAQHMNDVNISTMNKLNISSGTECTRLYNDSLRASSSTILENLINDKLSASSGTLIAQHMTDCNSSTNTLNLNKLNISSGPECERLFNDRLNASSGTETTRLYNVHQSSFNETERLINSKLNASSGAAITDLFDKTLLKDGTRALTGNWGVGGYNITGVGNINPNGTGLLGNITDGWRQVYLTSTSYIYDDTVTHGFQINTQSTATFVGMPFVEFQDSWTDFLPSRATNTNEIGIVGRLWNWGRFAHLDCPDVMISTNSLQTQINSFSGSTLLPYTTYQFVLIALSTTNAVDKTTNQTISANKTFMSSQTIINDAQITGTINTNYVQATSSVASPTIYTSSITSCSSAGTMLNFSTCPSVSSMRISHDGNIRVGKREPNGTSVITMNPSNGNMVSSGSVKVRDFIVNRGNMLITSSSGNRGSSITVTTAGDMTFKTYQYYAFQNWDNAEARLRAYYNSTNFTEWYHDNINTKFMMYTAGDYMFGYSDAWISSISYQGRGTFLDVECDSVNVRKHLKFRDNTTQTTAFSSTTFTALKSSTLSWCNDTICIIMGSTDAIGGASLYKDTYTVVLNYDAILTGLEIGTKVAGNLHICVSSAATVDGASVDISTGFCKVNGTRYKSDLNHVKISDGGFYFYPKGTALNFYVGDYTATSRNVSIMLYLNRRLYQ